MVSSSSGPLTRLTTPCAPSTVPSTSCPCRGVASRRAARSGTIAVRTCLAAARCGNRAGRRITVRTGRRHAGARAPSSCAAGPANEGESNASLESVMVWVLSSAEGGRVRRAWLCLASATISEGILGTLYGSGKRMGRLNYRAAGTATGKGAAVLAKALLLGVTLLALPLSASAWTALVIGDSIGAAYKLKRGGRLGSPDGRGAARALSRCRRGARQREHQRATRPAAACHGSPMPSSDSSRTSS